MCMETNVKMSMFRLQSYIAPTQQLDSTASAVIHSKLLQDYLLIYTALIDACPLTNLYMLRLVLSFYMADTLVHCITWYAAFV